MFLYLWKRLVPPLPFESHRPPEVDGSGAPSRTETVRTTFTLSTSTFTEFVTPSPHARGIARSVENVIRLSGRGSRVTSAVRYGMPGMASPGSGSESFLIVKHANPMRKYYV